MSTEHQTLELTQLLDETGRGSELDVQRSRARLKATEATIPPLEAAEKQAGYRLAVLLGERPGALDQELQPAAVATYAKALPIGDTAELLRRRPDVRAAERQLAAATARVGVATADLFPRVNVTGFVGFLSGDVGRLFGTTSGNNATRMVHHPDGELGGIRYWFGASARLRASEAQSDAAAANYEKVVLTALEDTENSFVAYSAAASAAQKPERTGASLAARRGTRRYTVPGGCRGLSGLAGRAAHTARCRGLRGAGGDGGQCIGGRDLQGPRRRRTAAAEMRSAAKVARIP